MGCKVKKAKDGAHLALQLFWNRIRSWETTRLEDTPENREFLQAKAVIISREMRKGTFDYVAHFPSGNRAHLFGAAPRISTRFESISLSGLSAACTKSDRSRCAAISRTSPGISCRP